MKAIITTSLLLLTFVQAFAADTLSSNITKATVFLSGAQVFRNTKTIAIKKGVNEVIIKDVSPYLNQQHIQATAKNGAFLILDVQYQTEYIVPVSTPPTIVPDKVYKEISSLNDSILFLSFEGERIRAKLNNLEEEKRMIIENQLIKSGGISDTLPEFKEIVEFYRKKLDEINELIYVWKKKQHYVTARNQKFQSRLNELNSFAANTNQPFQAPRTRYHILVTTYADVATSGEIEVNYLVPNAGWIPAYDLRADNTIDPMTVTYKARVYQNSGEDWDQVDLILSTYNQNCFTTKPILGIWRLDYVMNKPGNAAPQFFSQNFSSEVQMSQAQSGYQKQAENDNLTFEANRQFIPLQSMADINQNFSNVEFDVKLPYSIKSDGSQKLMVITNETIKAKYYHYMVPRSNKNGFLLAKISDWENLSLLPGPANIYFNHTIVGSTNIDPTIMSDTMEVTLGMDQGIVSTRKKVSEELKKTAITKRQIKTLTFEIEVKNLTKGEVNLTLEDLIPITSNEEILIELVDGDGGEFDKDTGKLTWKLNLKPGMKTSITFSYSVEHDKDKPIS